jgi:hypothetical protein
LQWFITQDKHGNARPRPLNHDLTTDEGKKTACKYLEWLGEGLPGMEYKRKADKLVSMHN